MWEELSEPWRACAEEAWEAYRAGSLPIGAVVTDARGNVVSRGRNRIHERSGPPSAVFGHNENDPRTCVLWTTTEPCPLCAGAARMADVGGLRYAAGEPWGGSAAMFETVPYLKRGGVRIVGPGDHKLEGVLVALQVECFLRLGPAKLEAFLRLYGEAMPAATQAGRKLHRSGALRAMSHEQSPASEVLARVSEEITPTT